VDIGAAVGNYQITSLLGEGGMGQVFEAEHPRIGKKVAVKVLRRELARDPEAVARFFTEARAVVKVGHENIIDISDFGQTQDGECYFIMELLAGTPLSSRMEDHGHLSWQETLHICSQVASALAAAHQHRILHRDLKPDNIYLVKKNDDPLFVKVLDFGLAKLNDAMEQGVKTKSGMVMGTPYYMSPEQAEGAADIDARTDVYALGVIMYQCLTGKVPFTGATFAQILVKHMTMEPVPPRQLRGEIPPQIEGLVLRAMAKNRDHRFQSMIELRGAMRSVGELCGIDSDSRVRMATPQGGVPIALDRTLASPVSVTPQPSPQVSVAGTPPGRVSHALSAAGALGSQPTMSLPSSMPPGVPSSMTPAPGFPPAHPSTLGAIASQQIPAPRPRRKSGMIVTVVAAVFIGAIAFAVVLKGTGSGPDPSKAPAQGAALAPAASPTPTPTAGSSPGTAMAPSMAAPASMAANVVPAAPTAGTPPTPTAAPTPTPAPSPIAQVQAPPHPTPSPTPTQNTPSPPPTHTATAEQKPPPATTPPAQTNPKPKKQQPRSVSPTDGLVQPSFN
jgi:serine/threonine-protein kinase